MRGRRNIPIHLFRTFPSGMAGLGLFLLRVITALMLGYSGYSLQEGSAAPLFSSARLVSILLPLLGVLMIVGLATMISGIVSCGLLLVSFVWLHPRSNGLSAVAASLSLVLMLLGPGAYSLDARFFGWRRVEIVRRTPKPKP
jgi:putative oxidoreductase